MLTGVIPIFFVIPKTSIIHAIDIKNAQRIKIHMLFDPKIIAIAAPKVDAEDIPIVKGLTR